MHYRDSDAVNELLESTRNWSRRPEHVVVADNSRDYVASPGTAAPEVIRMSNNAGYGAAANEIFRSFAGRADYVLLMTQDATLDPGSLERLHALLESHNDAAVAVPYLRYRSGPERVFSTGGIITKMSRTLHPEQGAPVATVKHRSPHDIAWGDGACLLLRLSALDQVGGFDESYFLYVEEVDLQYRLSRAGWKILADPQAWGAQEPGAYSLYYKYRNLTYFSSKHSELHPWPWLLALPKDVFRMIRLGRPSEFWRALAGLADKKRGRMGPNRKLNPA
ncbi:hypothetical protein GCM10022287_19650 [Gryllotalpicola koreensis]|uniref:Glycosyltransferase 2-like domain-containing protein n=1 Tax=Gryllotalpicola koreensis TaxID=993086 RepID=A0ABP8A0Y2_9MICO